MPVKTQISLYFFILKLFFLGFTSCDTEEAIPHKQDTGDLYFTARINEKPKHLVTGQNGYRQGVETASDINHTNPHMSNIIFKSYLVQAHSDFHISNHEKASLIFDNNRFHIDDYLNSSKTHFEQVFRPGNRIFCDSVQTSSACVEIIWRDVHGAIWTTRRNQQNNSSFNIKEAYFYPASSSDQILVRGSFSGYLQKSSAHHTISIKDGAFYLAFKNYK